MSWTFTDKKTQVLSVVGTGILAFAIGAGIYGNKDDNGSTDSGKPSVTAEQNLRQECSDDADAFDTRATSLSNRADDLSPYDSTGVASFVRQGRSLLADGHDILDKCGSLLDYSTRSELESLLDEFESSLDAVEAIYSN